MKLEIHTHDKTLIEDLLGDGGKTAEIPGNAILTYEGSYIRKAIGFPEIANVMLSFGEAVAAGVVANWLYAKLSHRTEKVVVDGREISGESDLKTLIEEELKLMR